ncbi:Hypothetical protein RG540_CH14010 [Neorhizobium galegae bv. orientalis str. HAMBI 540]|uniref:Uncharacterized protein n=1 Tax=Neorhizobium galegae bv. orientalis str. HAMBI 540 TaxID=1028800 RepID=A0A068SP81_NEOGA|nr:Hypothetical protein RG540_CH14010 [Neorhizobium galegae bv. orientalis str. HAMBI 540]
MSSPDYHPSNKPLSSAPLTFFRMLLDGWKSLGPRNLWFWLVPLMVICGVAGLFRDLWL